MCGGGGGGALFIVLVGPPLCGRVLYIHLRFFCVSVRPSVQNFSQNFSRNWLISFSDIMHEDRGS